MKFQSLYFKRFDIAFNNLDVLDQFEEELGIKHSDGSWQGQQYIVSFREEVNVKVLLTLFRRYEKEGLAEQASAVQCDCWVPLNEYEKIGEQ